MKHFAGFSLSIILSLFLTAGLLGSPSVITTNNPGASLQFSQNLNTYLVDIPNTLPIGNHEQSYGQQNQYSCLAEGWATDPDDRTIDLAVRILSDGVVVAQPVASNFRQDLDDAGVCVDGTCSFSVNLWGLISSDTDHSITEQAQDAQTGEWVTLYDSPKTINCAAPHAQTFVVNSTADSGDASLGNSTCETTTPTECTLRAAIEEANANPGMDTINFNIPGPGSHSISPSYGFDFISDPVIINGTTQPGYVGAPIIELDGSSAGPNAFGMIIEAGSSTIHGLAINRFALNGINLAIGGGNIIQGNYIGTDISGTVDLGNGGHGIEISQGSVGNLIGGITPADRNIISGNDQFGIIIVNPGSSGNVIQGNFVGTDVTGTIGLGNSSVGVGIGAEASNNLIGGTVPGARNLISGNVTGLLIDTTGTTGNLVQGNYIGTDVTGTQALGNVYEGVFIGTGASDNIIGGNTAGAGNLISGNQGNGVTIVDIGTMSNVVQGNTIGVDITGKLDLGNTTDGVLISQGASSNIIGGTAPGAGNLISGNDQNGISIYNNGTGNVVQGNYIGTNRTGTASISNHGNGVKIAGQETNNLIGGTAPGARNLISGNGSHGIVIIDFLTTGNIVQGNYIGTKANGTAPLPNLAAGIGVFSGTFGNLIGGTSSGAGNVIAFNNAGGIVLVDAGTGNVISSNSIFSNRDLGIDLRDDGVTANDAGDGDMGANNLQNYPELDSAKISKDNSYGRGYHGLLGELNGILKSTPNTTFKLEFFANLSCDPSHFGEGAILIATKTVKTDKRGRAQFTLTFVTALDSAKFITATATDPNGNTSEFSQCVKVQQNH